MSLSMNSPERVKFDNLSVKFEALAKALLSHLKKLLRFREASHCAVVFAFKETCCEFLKNFMPLSQPLFYMEFNHWHQKQIHHAKLVTKMCHRLLFVATSVGTGGGGGGGASMRQEEILILKILGVLMRNPPNRLTLQRCGAIQTLMTIIQRPRPELLYSPPLDVGAYSLDQALSDVDAFYPLQIDEEDPHAAGRAPGMPLSRAPGVPPPPPRGLGALSPPRAPGVPPPLNLIDDHELHTLTSAFDAMSLLGGGMRPVLAACGQCAPPNSCPNTVFPGVSDHTDAREEACVVLRRLALDMRPAEEICRLNGIYLFLQTIGNTGETLEFRDKICAVLGNSFCSVTEKAQFASLGGFQTLLQAMRDSIPHTHFLEVYCRAIANAIANYPQNKNEFTQQGGIPLILDILRDQPLQSDFLAMTLRVLTNVSRCTAGINEIARNHGMQRLIELCARVEHADLSGQKSFTEKNSFSDAELASCEQPTSPRIKSTVDRGILFCFEEFVYQDLSLREFYQHDGLKTLVSIMRREYRNDRVLQYACKTTREVINASRGIGAPTSEGSQTISTGYRFGGLGDDFTREEFVAMWMEMIDEAVLVIRSFPYYGQYAREFPLNEAREDTRPLASCEPGPPAKRVRFHYCALIEDIVGWFPVRGARHVARHHYMALTSPSKYVHELDVLPRDLLKLVCDFLPVQEWTC